MNKEQLQEFAIGHYVAGVTDGEGSFYTAVRKRNSTEKDGGPSTVNRWRFSVAFNISQNDKKLLQVCKDALKCGSIRQTFPSKKERDQLQKNKEAKALSQLQKIEKFVFFEVNQLVDLKEKVIPFFKKYPFHSVKKTHELKVFEELVDYLLSLDQGIQTKEQAQVFCNYRKELGKYRVLRFENSDETILFSF